MLSGQKPPSSTLSDFFDFIERPTDSSVDGRERLRIASVRHVTVCVCRVRQTPPAGLHFVIIHFKKQNAMDWHTAAY